MRFYELQAQPLDKFILALKTYIGDAAIHKNETKFNWAGFANMMRSQGYEMAADYEVFKAIYDQLPPAMQDLVLDYNDSTIELNVPGVKVDNPELDPGEDSQNAVNQMAASAAPAQLAQQSKTPPVPTV